MYRSLRLSSDGRLMARGSGEGGVQDPKSDMASGMAGKPANPWRRFTPLLLIVILALVVFAMGWHRALSLENLVRHHAMLSDLVGRHVVASLAAFVAIYIAVVTLSLPGGSVLTVTGGLLFGCLWGGVAAIVAATIGASFIFLIARSAFGGFLMRRAGSRLTKLAEGFRDDAFSYLLFLRLVPVFPFFLVNLAPALVGVGLGPFVAATALGIIPATFAFAFVGAGLDSVIDSQAQGFHACEAAGRSDCKIDFNIGAALTPELFAAIAALGLVALIPIVVKRLRARQRSS